MARKLSKEELELRVNEAGSGRYKFIRWAVDGEFGSQKKCVVRCIKDKFEWEARVTHLLSCGSGCPKCSGNIAFTQEEQEDRLNNVKNVEFVRWIGLYENSKSKAVLKCKIDGFTWESNVDNAIRGKRCPQCSKCRRWTANDRVSQINSLSNIEFVRWADGYSGAKSEAVVRCLVHGGEWQAKVYNLLTGYGCPRCAKTGFDQTKVGTLYALRSECGMYVKVGISNKPSQRHRALELATPFSFSCIEKISGDGSKIAELEKYLHNKYERAGFVGFDGCTEWLICTPELLEELRKLGDK